MSNESGFYSIITDGISFYFSNAYRKSISLINPEGKLIADYIKVTHPFTKVPQSPYALALGPNILIVQTLTHIKIYAVDLTYQTYEAINTNNIEYESSNIYPSIAYIPKERKLYISNYTAGTIISINDSGQFTQVLSNVYGISGLGVASNILYFSNYLQNTVSYITNNIVKEYIKIDKPRGLYYSNSVFYICYGEKTTTYGILAYSATTDQYGKRRVENIIYYTMEGMNIIYKDNSPFVTVTFLDSSDTYVPSPNNNGITQSALISNPNCLANPAYTKLIQLRTIGSNPSNPITPVTTIIGRLSGANIKFDPGNGTSYEELKMRRKAEVLKYRTSENSAGYTLNNKQSLSSIVRNGGSYHFSKARLNSILQNNCKVGVDNGAPIVVSPPSNSGVNDTSIEGYYLNPYIPFFTSL
jgi:hypothetical protein